MPSLASGSVATSGLPFAFNPPMHPSLQHVFPEIGLTAGTPYDDVLKYMYDESANSYSGDTAFNNLRLGRIVMGKDAMSFVLKQMGTRFGFRFLYNPNAISGSQNVGTDFIADPSNAVTAVLQEGLENINFQLRLVRTPEVMGEPPLSEYHPVMSGKDMAQIKERGTHYDLEFLYRVCNGVHNTTVRSGTGDIGILLPNPCELYLGPFRSRGALMSISATDIMFSPDMVPMVTDVTIQFSRFLTIANANMVPDGSGSPTSVPVPVKRLVSSNKVLDLSDILRGGVLGGIAGVIGDWVSGGDSGGDDSGGGGGGGGSAPGGAPGGGSTPSGGAGWTLAPSLKKLGDDAQAKYSQVGVVGAYRNQNGSGHQKVGSGSESKGTTGSVHSIDIMINVSSQSMTLLNKLLTKCRSGDTRLWYLIHDRRIWSKNHGWAERPYTGAGTAHLDHIHVSLNGDTTAIGVKNENDLSDWGI